MNRVLAHFCAHRGPTGYIVPGEPPENGEMTLPSWHRIRNSNPGGLRPSTEAPHNAEFYEWMGIHSNRRDQETNPELQRER